jgi:hypothetical protein
MGSEKSDASPLLALGGAGLKKQMRYAGRDRRRGGILLGKLLLGPGYSAAMTASMTPLARL